MPPVTPAEKLEAEQSLRSSGKKQRISQPAVATEVARRRILRGDYGDLTPKNNYVKAAGDDLGLSERQRLELRKQLLEAMPVRTLESCFATTDATPQTAAAPETQPTQPTARQAAPNDERWMHGQQMPQPIGFGLTVDLFDGGYTYPEFVMSSAGLRCKGVLGDCQLTNSCGYNCAEWACMIRALGTDFHTFTFDEASVVLDPTFIARRNAQLFGSSDSHAATLNNDQIHELAAIQNPDGAGTEASWLTVAALDHWHEYFSRTLAEPSTHNQVHIMIVNTETSGLRGMHWFVVAWVLSDAFRNAEEEVYIRYFKPAVSEEERNQRRAEQQFDKHARQSANDVALELCRASDTAQCTLDEVLDELIRRAPNCWIRLSDLASEDSDDSDESDDLGDSDDSALDIFICSNGMFGTKPGHTHGTDLRRLICKNSFLLQGREVHML